MLYVFLFFFFKQKTAYEMRISDWSSDVCSSDLRFAPTPMMSWCGFAFSTPVARRYGGRPATISTAIIGRDAAMRLGTGRSEEHTSELQSLMRISYAVFCLKKKTIENKRTSQTNVKKNTQNNKYQKHQQHRIIHNE